MKKLVTVRNDHNAFKLVHSTTVLNLTRNELLHCSVLLPGIVEPRVVDFVSGISVNGVVTMSDSVITTEGGQANFLRFLASRRFLEAWLGCGPQQSC